VECCPLDRIAAHIAIFLIKPTQFSPQYSGDRGPFGLTNDGIESGVGLYIDDVFYARPASAAFDFIDLESLEIVRGPQGTLYGKNTTAGAINLRTRAPSFEPEGRGELTLGRFGFVQAKASLSGPLIDDRVAGRFSFTTTQREGTVRNVTTNVDVNDQNNIAFRGQLLWLLNEEIKLTLSGDYNRQRLECCTQVIAGVAPTLRSENRQFFNIIEDLGYTPPTLNPFDRITDVDSDLQANQNLGGASIKVEWDTGSGTLTSVSAWRFWDWDPSNDRDFIGLPVTTLSQNPSEQRQWTQEFRYASTLGSNIDYVAGLFFFRQSIDSLGTQEQGAAATRFLLAPAAGNTPELLDGLRQDSDISLDTTSIAAFTQATWRATDRLSFTPGLRLNFDSKTGEFRRTVSGGLQTDDPVLIARQLSVLRPQSFDVDFDDFNVSGQISANYELTDDLFAFVTWARSFKSGGFNIGGLPAGLDGLPATEVAEIDPEDVRHIEAGLKSTLFNGALTANLTVYRTNIEDFQSQVVNAEVGVLRGFLANAEKVRVRGIELDIAGRLGPNVDFYVNTAFTDGEYVSFVDAPCPLELTGGPAFCDVSGQDLPGISKWATSFGGEYHVPARIATFNGEAYLGIDASYQSSFSSSASPSEFLVVDERTLVNFRGGFRSDGPWEVFAWVRNAFDKDHFEFLSAVGGNSGLFVGQLGDPRTYGLTLRTKF
jgi:iron complex outermembrane receptor protein